MKVGIAFIEGRTPQGPAHGQVSVLPGISTRHSSRLVEHAKLTRRVEAGLAGQEGRVSLARCLCQMGQPVSLGHGGARAPWE